MQLRIIVSKDFPLLDDIVVFLNLYKVKFQIEIGNNISNLWINESSSISGSLYSIYDYIENTYNSYGEGKL